jgi:hypothetical protein
LPDVSGWHSVTVFEAVVHRTGAAQDEARLDRVNPDAGITAIEEIQSSSKIKPIAGTCVTLGATYFYQRRFKGGSVGIGDGARSGFDPLLLSGHLLQVDTRRPGEVGPRRCSGRLSSLSVSSR